MSPDIVPTLARALSYSAFCGAPESTQGGTRLCPSVPLSKPLSTRVPGPASARLAPAPARTTKVSITPRRSGTFRRPKDQVDLNMAHHPSLRVDTRSSMGGAHNRTPGSPRLPPSDP